MKKKNQKASNICLAVTNGCIHLGVLIYFSRAFSTVLVEIVTLVGVINVNFILF